MPPSETAHDGTDGRDFASLHLEQLKMLNIPESLYGSLSAQLERTFSPQDEDLDATIQASFENMNTHAGQSGAIIVMPHICSWDMILQANDGMYKALLSLSLSVLGQILDGLNEVNHDNISSKLNDDTLQKRDMETKRQGKDAVIDEIMPMAWSRVILYRERDTVRGALPSPPYPPQSTLIASSDDETEADLLGPFPFVYLQRSTPGTSSNSQGGTPCSLSYLSPDWSSEKSLPTIDLVPRYSVPNGVTRSIRYAALLGIDGAPEFAIQSAKNLYANFVHTMHLARQKNLEEATAITFPPTTELPPDDSSKMEPSKPLLVYTDSNDPMELAHPVAGLTSPYFALTSSMEDADIIYSYRHLYAPGPNNLKNMIESKISEGRAAPLVNQFPYEGAFVQKDHLGRELLKQHGLPRPNWAIETYDLDVQLGEFVGAAILAQEKHRQQQVEKDELSLQAEEHAPLWIIKPAGGTQSKGHVVTSSIAQVLKIVDAGGGSRVAQRYIVNPICYDERKIDCRCIVMMTSASPGQPSLYMHNRTYFRIAEKKHSVLHASDLIDHKNVLTAMHLVKEYGSDHEGNPSSKHGHSLLPVDYKTIAKLESDYGDLGFDWNENILPKIHALIRELMVGMTRAYPQMGDSSIGRALYGVDIMFEITGDAKLSHESARNECVIEPKLTEVSFCPANNAVCDAYERDDDLYKGYINDVFSCLFLDKPNKETIKRLL